MTVLSYLLKNGGCPTKYNQREGKSSDNDRTHNQTPSLTLTCSTGFLRAKRTPDIMVETTAIIISVIILGDHNTIALPAL